MNLKYILSIAGAYLVYKYLAKGRIEQEEYYVPAEWMIKPFGYTYFNIPEGFYSSGEKNTLRWASLSMKWGVGYGLDPALILGCIYSESAGNENARRWEANVGESSYGLMQTLWSTAKEVIGWLKTEPYGQGAANNIVPMGFSLTPEALLIPNVSVMIGARYLFKQYLRYAMVPGKDRVLSMFAAYNAGTAYRNAKGEYTNSKGDTRVNDYVKKCLNASQNFRYVLNNNFPAYTTMFPKSIWQYSGI